jgi:hypothetical protein
MCSCGKNDKSKCSCNKKEQHLRFKYNSKNPNFTDVSSPVSNDYPNNIIDQTFVRTPIYSLKNKQIGYKVSNAYVQQIESNKFVVRGNSTYTFMSKGVEVGSLSWIDVYTNTINSNLYPVNIPIKSKIISGSGVFLNATGKVTTLAKTNGDRLFDVKFDKKQ